MLRLLFKLSGVTLLLVLLFLTLEAKVPTWVSPRIYYLLGVFYLLTLVTAGLNIWAARQGNLVTIFIASQVLRIILSLVILYIFMRWSPDEAHALVVNFFIIYLSFLIFEIIAVLSNLRAELRKPE